MAKVFPLADMLDFKVDPDFYRTAVGVVEVVCGIILAMIPGSSSCSCSSSGPVVVVVVV